MKIKLLYDVVAMLTDEQRSTIKKGTVLEASKDREGRGVWVKWRIKNNPVMNVLIFEGEYKYDRDDR